MQLNLMVGRKGELPIIMIAFQVLAEARMEYNSFSLFLFLNNTGIGHCLSKERDIALFGSPPRDVKE